MFHSLINRLHLSSNWKLELVNKLTTKEENTKFLHLHLNENQIVQSPHLVPCLPIEQSSNSFTCKTQLYWLARSLNCNLFLWLKLFAELISMRGRNKCHHTQWEFTMAEENYFSTKFLTIFISQERKTILLFVEWNIVYFHLAMFFQGALDNVHKTRKTEKHKQQKKSNFK